MTSHFNYSQYPHHSGHSHSRQFTPTKILARLPSLTKEEVKAIKRNFVSQHPEQLINNKDIGTDYKCMSWAIRQVIELCPECIDIHQSQCSHFPEFTVEDLRHLLEYLTQPRVISVQKNHTFVSSLAELLFEQKAAMNHSNLMHDNILLSGPQLIQVLKPFIIRILTMYIRKVEQKDHPSKEMIIQTLQVMINQMMEDNHNTFNNNKNPFIQQLTVEFLLRPSYENINLDRSIEITARSMAEKAHTTPESLRETWEKSAIEEADSNKRSLYFGLEGQCPVKMDFRSADPSYDFFFDAMAIGVGQLITEWCLFVRNPQWVELSHAEKLEKFLEQCAESADQYFEPQTPMNHFPIALALCLTGTLTPMYPTGHGTKAWIRELALRTDGVRCFRKFLPKIGVGFNPSFAEIFSMAGNLSNKKNRVHVAIAMAIQGCLELLRHEPVGYEEKIKEILECMTRDDRFTKICAMHPDSLWSKLFNYLKDQRHAKGMKNVQALFMIYGFYSACMKPKEEALIRSQITPDSPLKGSSDDCSSAFELTIDGIKLQVPVDMADSIYHIQHQGVFPRSFVDLIASIPLPGKIRDTLDTGVLKLLGVLPETLLGFSNALYAHALRGKDELAPLMLPAFLIYRYIETECPLDDLFDKIATYLLGKPQLNPQFLYMIASGVSLLRNGLLKKKWVQFCDDCMNEPSTNEARMLQMAQSGIGDLKIIVQAFVTHDVSKESITRLIDILPIDRTELKMPLVERLILRFSADNEVKQRIYAFLAHQFNRLRRNTSMTDQELKSLALLVQRNFAFATSLFPIEKILALAGLLKLRHFNNEVKALLDCCIRSRLIPENDHRVVFLLSAPRSMIEPKKIIPAPTQVEQRLAEAMNAPSSPLIERLENAAKDFYAQNKDNQTQKESVRIVEVKEAQPLIIEPEEPSVPLTAMEANKVEKQNENTALVEELPKKTSEIEIDSTQMHAEEDATKEEMAETIAPVEIQQEEATMVEVVEEPVKTITLGEMAIEELIQNANEWSNQLDAHQIDSTTLQSFFAIVQELLNRGEYAWVRSFLIKGSKQETVYSAPEFVQLASECVKNHLAHSSEENSNNLLQFYIKMKKTPFASTSQAEEWLLESRALIAPALTAKLIETKANDIITHFDTSSLNVDTKTALLTYEIQSWSKRKNITIEQSVSQLKAIASTHAVEMSDVRILAAINGSLNKKEIFLILFKENNQWMTEKACRTWTLERLKELKFSELEANDISALLVHTLEFNSLARGLWIEVMAKADKGGETIPRSLLNLFMQSSLKKNPRSEHYRNIMAHYLTQWPVDLQKGKATTSFLNAAQETINALSESNLEKIHAAWLKQAPVCTLNQAKALRRALEKNSYRDIVAKLVTLLPSEKPVSPPSEQETPQPLQEEIEAKQTETTVSSKGAESAVTSEMTEKKEPIPSEVTPSAPKEMTSRQQNCIQLVKKMMPLCTDAAKQMNLLTIIGKMSLEERIAVLSDKEIRFSVLIDSVEGFLYDLASRELGSAYIEKLKGVLQGDLPTSIIRDFMNRIVLMIQRDTPLRSEQIVSLLKHLADEQPGIYLPLLQDLFRQAALRNDVDKDILFPDDSVRMLSIYSIFADHKQASQHLAWMSGAQQEIVELTPLNNISESHQETFVQFILKAADGHMVKRNILSLLHSICERLHAEEVQLNSSVVIAVRMALSKFMQSNGPSLDEQEIDELNKVLSYFVNWFQLASNEEAHYFLPGISFDNLPLRTKARFIEYFVTAQGLGTDYIEISKWYAFFMSKLNEFATTYSQEELEKKLRILKALPLYLSTLVIRRYQIGKEAKQLIVDRQEVCNAIQALPLHEDEIMMIKLSFQLHMGQRREIVNAVDPANHDVKAIAYAPIEQLELLLDAPITDSEKISMTLHHIAHLSILYPMDPEWNSQLISCFKRAVEKGAFINQPQRQIHFEMTYMLRYTPEQVASFTEARKEVLRAYLLGIPIAGQAVPQANKAYVLSAYCNALYTTLPFMIQEPDLLKNWMQAILANCFASSSESIDPTVGHPAWAVCAVFCNYLIELRNKNEVTNELLIKLKPVLELIIRSYLDKLQLQTNASENKAVGSHTLDLAVFSLALRFAGLWDQDMCQRYDSLIGTHLKAQLIHYKPVDIKLYFERLKFYLPVVMQSPQHFEFYFSPFWPSCISMEWPICPNNLPPFMVGLDLLIPPFKALPDSLRKEKFSEFLPLIERIFDGMHALISTTQLPENNESMRTPHFVFFTLLNSFTQLDLLYDHPKYAGWIRDAAIARIAVVETMECAESQKTNLLQNSLNESILSAQATTPLAERKKLAFESLKALTTGCLEHIEQAADKSLAIQRLGNFIIAIHHKLDIDDAVFIDFTHWLLKTVFDAKSHKSYFKELVSTLIAAIDGDLVKLPRNEKIRKHAGKLLEEAEKRIFGLDNRIQSHEDLKLLYIRIILMPKAAVDKAIPAIKPDTAQKTIDVLLNHKNEIFLSSQLVAIALSQAKYAAAQNLTREQNDAIAQSFLKVLKTLSELDDHTIGLMLEEIASSNWLEKSNGSEQYKKQIQGYFTQYGIKRQKHSAAPSHSQSKKGKKAGRRG